MGLYAAPYRTTFGEQNIWFCKGLLSEAEQASNQGVDFGSVGFGSANPVHSFACKSKGCLRTLATLLLAKLCNLDLQAKLLSSARTSKQGPTYLQT